MRLIPHFDKLDPTHLNDLLIIMAKNVEDSLLETGAIPGDDYTIIDLYQLANPLVANHYATQNIAYTQQWRDQ